MRDEALVTASESLTIQRTIRRWRWRVVSVPIRAIADLQLRGLDSFPAFLLRNQQRVERAAREQCPLNGPCRFAGEHHHLDAVEKIGEVHERTPLLRPE